jgi:uncharacterized protein (DUF302 family)
MEPPSEHDLKTLPSRYSVAETLDRVEASVKAGGMSVFARVDHAGEATRVGLTMRPTELLIFGNPRGGTPIMVARPTAAIDLPLKALAWQDESGQVWLTYNTAGLLVERHGVPQELAAKLAPVEALLERTVS